MLSRKDSPRQSWCVSLNTSSHSECDAESRFESCGLRRSDLDARTRLVCRFEAEGRGGHEGNDLLCVQPVVRLCASTWALSRGADREA